MAPNIRKITTENAPQPAGHYSQGVVHNGTLYVAGQLAIDPATGERILEAIEVQTQRALRNVLAIVQAAGGSLHTVLKVNIYISDIGLWDRVNRVYEEFFGEHRPARAVIPSRELHHGFLIEIEAVAAVD